MAFGLLALGIVGCERALPPGLGDPIPEAYFTVVEPTGTDWDVGARVRLSQFEGKPVILDYWASWCWPCRGQHEYLMDLKAKYGDDIQVLGVLFEDSDENATAWLGEHGASYPTVREVYGTIRREFWISGIPRFIMLTPDRRLAWDMVGPTFPDSVTVRLDRMIADAVQ